MVSVDCRQLDFFESNGGFRNAPPPSPRSRFLGSIAEVLYRREVRRLSNFKLENSHFCLMTRPWFWPDELMKRQVLELEMRRRKANERRLLSLANR